MNDQPILSAPATPQASKRAAAITALGPRIAWASADKHFVAFHTVGPHETTALLYAKVHIVLFVSPFVAHRDRTAYIARGLRRRADIHSVYDFPRIIQTAISQAAWRADDDIRYGTIADELRLWQFPRNDLAVCSPHDAPAVAPFSADMVLLAALLDSVARDVRALGGQK